MKEASSLLPPVMLLSERGNTREEKENKVKKAHSEDPTVCAHLFAIHSSDTNSGYFFPLH